MTFIKITFLLFILVCLAVVAIWRTCPEIPFERSLKSYDGRTIECLVVGKAGDELIIERKPEMKEFRFSINRLSLVDKYYFKLIADKAPPEKPDPETKLGLDSAEPLTPKPTAREPIKSRLKGATGLERKT